MADKKQLYVCVPNKLIKYSCTINHYILPVYLYSAINQNINNNNRVDTNMAHIIETFTPNVDNRRQIYREYYSAFKPLFGEIEDVEIENKKSIVYGFDACLMDYYNLTTKSEDVDLVAKGDRINYSVVGNGESSAGWTPFTFDEYYYFINYMEHSEAFKDKFDVRELNLISILNFYSYLKMRIITATNATKDNDKKVNSLSITNNFLAEVMGIGKNTVTKYIHQLEFLGLIEVTKNNSLIIKLSDKWRKF